MRGSDADFAGRGAAFVIIVDPEVARQFQRRPILAVDAPSTRVENAGVINQAGSVIPYAE